MGRPHRYLAAGAYYHVGTKGNNDAPIFQDNWDRAVFLHILRRVKRRYRWRLHARCLLGNHYHLLVETPLANLSDGMRDLNGQYARAFNERHRRKHHVFGQLVEGDRVGGSVRLHPRLHPHQSGPPRLRPAACGLGLDVGARGRWDRFASCRTTPTS